jgi:hypothetical protein
VSGPQAFFRALAMQLLVLAAVATFVLGGQHLFSVIGFESMASSAEMSLGNHAIYAAALLPCAVVTSRFASRLKRAFDAEPDMKLRIRERAGLPARGARA